MWSIIVVVVFAFALAAARRWLTRQQVKAPVVISRTGTSESADQSCATPKEEDVSSGADATTQKLAAPDDAFFTPPSSQCWAVDVVFANKEGIASEEVRPLPCCATWDEHRAVAVFAKVVSSASPTEANRGDCWTTPTTSPGPLSQSSSHFLGVVNPLRASIFQVELDPTVSTTTTSSSTNSGSSHPTIYVSEHDELRRHLHRVQDKTIVELSAAQQAILLQRSKVAEQQDKAAGCDDHHVEEQQRSPQLQKGLQSSSKRRRVFALLVTEECFSKKNQDAPSITKIHDADDDIFVVQKHIRSALVVFQSRKQRLYFVEEMLYAANTAPLGNAAQLLDGRQSWNSYLARVEASRGGQSAHTLVDVVANRYVRSFDASAWEATWLTLFQHAVSSMKFISIASHPVLQISLVSVKGVKDVYPTLDGVVAPKSKVAASSDGRLDTITTAEGLMNLRANIACPSVIMRFACTSKIPGAPAFNVDVRVDEWKALGVLLSHNRPPSDTLWIQLNHKPTFTLKIAFPDASAKLPRGLLHMLPSLETYLLDRVKDRMEKGILTASNSVRISFKKLGIAGVSSPNVKSSQGPHVMSVSETAFAAASRSARLQKNVSDFLVRKQGELEVLASCLELRVAALHDTKQELLDVCIHALTADARVRQKHRDDARRSQEIETALDARAKELMRMQQQLRQEREDFERQKADMLQDLRAAEVVGGQLPPPSRESSNPRLSRRSTDDSQRDELHAQSASGISWSVASSPMQSVAPIRGPPSAVPSGAPRVPLLPLHTLRKSPQPTTISHDAPLDIGSSTPPETPQELSQERLVTSSQLSRPSARSNDTQTAIATPPKLSDRRVAIAEPRIVSARDESSFHAETPSASLSEPPLLEVELTEKPDEPFVPAGKGITNVEQPVTSNSHTAADGDAAAIVGDGVAQQPPVVNSTNKIAEEYLRSASFSPSTPIAVVRSAATIEHSALVLDLMESADAAVPSESPHGRLFAALHSDVAAAIALDCAILCRAPRHQVAVSDVSISRNPPPEAPVCGDDVQPAAAQHRSKWMTLQFVVSLRKLSPLSEPLPELLRRCPFRETRAAIDSFTQKLSRQHSVSSTPSGSRTSLRSDDRFARPTTPGPTSLFRTGSPALGTPPPVTSGALVTPGERRRESPSHVDSVQKLRRARDEAIERLRTVQRQGAAVAPASSGHSSASLPELVEAPDPRYPFVVSLVACDESSCRADLEVLEVQERVALRSALRSANAEAAVVAERSANVACVEHSYSARCVALDGISQLLLSDEAALRQRIESSEYHMRNHFALRRTHGIDRMAFHQQQRVVDGEGKMRQTLWREENFSRAVTYRAMRESLNVDATQDHAALCATISESEGHDGEDSSNRSASHCDGYTGAGTRDSVQSSELDVAAAVHQDTFTFHYAVFEANDMKHSRSRGAVFEGILKCHISRDLTVTVPVLEGCVLQEGDVLLDVYGRALHSHKHLRDLLAERALKIKNVMLQKNPSVDWWLHSTSSECAIAALTEAHALDLLVIRQCEVVSLRVLT